MTQHLLARYRPAADGGRPHRMLVDIVAPDPTTPASTHHRGASPRPRRPGGWRARGLLSASPPLVVGAGAGPRAVVARPRGCRLPPATGTAHRVERHNPDGRSG